jgi:hypothetical protein
MKKYKPVGHARSCVTRGRDELYRRINPKVTKDNQTRSDEI